MNIDITVYRGKELNPQIFQVFDSRVYPRKAFLGYKLRDEYDYKRLKIPSKYRPSYIEINNIQYYGMWINLTEKGNRLHKDILTDRVNNHYNTKHIDQKIISSYKLNILDSFAHNTRNIFALTIPNAKEYIPKEYHTFDTDVYTQNDLPGYIKISSAYVFFVF